MNPWTFRTAVTALLATVPVAAQSLPGGGADLDKGPSVPKALSPAEWQALRAQQRPLAPDVPEFVRSAPAPRLDRVVVDRHADDSWMAVGATYKGSFGPDGFTYVPFFGSDAPQNYPVRFALRGVTVGGVPLPLASAAKAGADGTVLTLDHGAVQERYALALDQVEQTFVIDGAEPGDVVLELAVETELQEDTATPGLQFANALGRVDYGTAYLVTGGVKTRIESEWTGESIRMHVPASMRREGPVVIDPIIRTVPFAFTGTQNSLQPDIAYDATNERFLLVWEYAYSAADHDIWCELRDGIGSPIPGSVTPIDVSTSFEGVPRVANINATDRFAVVYEKTSASTFQGRTMIFARFHDAASSVASGSPFQLSDPTLPGNNWAPDVGGDGGSGPYWCVAWMLQVSASESWILTRTFHSNGNATANQTTIVEASSGRVYANVAVSQSNGVGSTGTPEWCLVYEYMYSATDWDIYATMVNSAASVVLRRFVDAAIASDKYPSVSSPATDLGVGACFMITYERQSPLQARGVLVDAFLNRSGATDLSGAFGLGPFWVRCESDGCRFAVVNGSSTISVATLGFHNGAFSLHDAPQALSGVPAFPRICSERSGGGRRTDYAIAWVDQWPVSDVIRVTRYAGHQPGATFSRRAMACSALQIDVVGFPFLGREVLYALRNFGTDILGAVLGAPAAPSTVLCAQCPIGVDLAGPTAVYAGQSATLPIPCVAPLVGVTLSLQGFGIGSGPCVASLRFTDTVDFTIR